MLVREYYRISIIKDIDKMVPVPDESEKNSIKNALVNSSASENWIIENVEWEQMEDVLPLSENT